MSSLVQGRAGVVHVKMSTLTYVICRSQTTLLMHTSPARTGVVRVKMLHTNMSFVGLYTLKCILLRPGLGLYTSKCCTQHESFVGLYTLKCLTPTQNNSGRDIPLSKGWSSHLGIGSPSWGLWMSGWEPLGRSPGSQPKLGLQPGLGLYISKGRTPAGGYG